MALLDDVLKNGAGGGLATGLGVGIGMAVVMPVVLPLLRTVAKTVIRTGMMVYDEGRHVYDDLAEGGGGLMAEAREELAARGAEPPVERPARRTAADRAVAARRAEVRATRKVEHVPTRAVTRTGRTSRAAGKAKKPATARKTRAKRTGR
jgi:hypothetical protein